MIRKTLCMLQSLIALLLLMQNSQQLCCDFTTKEQCEQQCYPGCQFVSCYAQNTDNNVKTYNFSVCVNITRHLNAFQGFCGQQLSGMSKNEDECCQGDGYFKVKGCNKGQHFNMSHKFVQETGQKKRTYLVMYIVIGIMLLVVLICCKYWDDGETEVVFEDGIVDQSVFNGQSDSSKKLLKVEFEDFENRNPSDDQKVMKLWNQKYGIKSDKHQGPNTEMHNPSLCQTNSCHHKNVRSVQERKLDEFDKQ